MPATSSEGGLWFVAALESPDSTGVVVDPNLNGGQPVFLTVPPNYTLIIEQIYGSITMDEAPGTDQGLADLVLFYGPDTSLGPAQSVEHFIYLERMSYNPAGTPASGNTPFSGPQKDFRVDGVDLARHTFRNTSSRVPIVLYWWIYDADAGGNIGYRILVFCKYTLHWHGGGTAKDNVNESLEDDVITTTYV